MQSNRPKRSLQVALLKDATLTPPGSSTDCTLEGYRHYHSFALGRVTREAQLAQTHGFLVLGVSFLRLIGQTLRVLPLSMREQFLRFTARRSIS